MPEIAPSNVVRKKLSRRDSQTAKPPPSSYGDRMLAVSGVLIACCSLAFAGYMMADVDRPARIVGMEYLSIFARPSHSLIAAEPPKAPASVEATNNFAPQSVDPTPTGSIRESSVSARPLDLIVSPVRELDPKAPPSAYKLLEVSDGEALIESETGFRRVKVGDVLPDLGRVKTIEKRGDHWLLTTQNGAPLEWTAPAPTTIGTTASAKKPLQR